jgi:hypothetical protein
MKINGRKLDKIIEVLVIPRQDGDIVFKAQPVTDYTEFSALCPEPKPPMIKHRDGIDRPDFEDKDYKAALDNYATRRTDWMILTSLSATEGIEWEDVCMSDPSTWHLYTKELGKSGLANAEINRIINLVISANGLDQKKIDEATKAFLALKAAPEAAK